MASTLGANLLKFVGLMGSPNTAPLVPRANTPQGNQEMYRDFIDAGKVADADIWNRYNLSLKRPVTFESMLALWDEMSAWDLLACALQEICNEATQIDANSPATLWYECNDSKFKDELNNMLVRVESEDIIRSQIWHVSALGNNYEHIDYAPSVGVTGLVQVHPTLMRRRWLERNGKCIGFSWAGHKPSKESIYVGLDNKTAIPRYALGDGKSTEDLWYPHDFLHMRNMGAQRHTQHGEPVFADADGIYKKLRIAVDQMVVMRAQVQPDRYVVNVDVKDQAPIEQMKTMQRWKQSLRSKLSFGQPAGGTPFGGMSAPTAFHSFHNAWALDTILWVAKPRDMEHTVIKLPGTVNVPDVYDIEILTDLFYSIIGMPRSWFSSRSGEGGGAGNPPSGKALLAQDMRFLRKIKAIRKPVINAYTWLGYFHALLQGKDIRQLDIKACMPPIGSLEDELKMDLLGKQAGVLVQLAGVMKEYSLPQEAWVELVFKKYLHLPDEVVNIFVTALPAEMETQPVESLKKKSAPYSYRLLRQIEEKVQADPETVRMVNTLRETVYGEDPNRAYKAQRRVYEHRDIITVPSTQELHEDDLVISSHSENPFKILKSIAPGQVNETCVLQPMVDSQSSEAQPINGPSLMVEGQSKMDAYRQWMPGGEK